MMKATTILTDRQTDRQTSIECLRIISMLMIVMGHSVVHGGFTDIPTTVNGLFAIGLTQGSRIGVDIFVLIAGYFSTKGAPSFNKLKKLYLQIWTYSIVVTVISVLIGGSGGSIKVFISAMLPVSTSQYWFATCYFMLLLISPILQAYIEKASQKTYTQMLLIMLTAWSILPTLHIGNPGYSNFCWFMFLYLLGAYLKKYPNSTLSSIKIWHGIALYFLITMLTVATYYYGYSIHFLKENAIYLYGEMNKGPAVMCAVLLFLGFRNWKGFQSKFINKVAACTFGVYLLHDNPQIRSILWCDLARNADYLDSSIFPFRMIISVMLVFSVGIAVEYTRKQLVKGAGNAQSIFKRIQKNKA